MVEAGADTWTVNRNLGRALPAAFFVAGAGLAAQWTTRTADGRLVSAALLVVVLTGTFLLHRGAGLGHRGMSATTWRSFTVAGTVLVAGAVADLVLATVGRPGASQGLPLAIAALIAGPLVLRGVVRWNPDVQHVLEEGHGLITASAVLVLAGAGNLVLPWLPSEVAGGTRGVCRSGSSAWPSSASSWARASWPPASAVWPGTCACRCSAAPSSAWDWPTPPPR